MATRRLPDLTIDQAITDFARDLRLDKSDRTIATYSEAARLYARWAADHGITTLRQITTPSIRAWLTSLRDAGRTPGTLLNRHSGLKALLRWAVDERLLSRNPMDRVPMPKVEANPVPLVSVADLRRLVGTADGPQFENLRDAAMLRLLIDTGMRRAECAGLETDDIDFEHDVAHVVGKGSRPRACPFGPRTARALRRYLRARSTHGDAHLPALWLGRRGPIAARAILDIVRRRGREAGVPDLYVHQLRHVWAHEALASGMSEGDVQRLGGWRDRDMLARYGASGADARARAAYKAHSLGDRI